MREARLPGKARHEMTAAVATVLPSSAGRWRPSTSTSSAPILGRPKACVERMNKTLQDRLVKEMRLREISTMQAANAYAPEFMIDYNRRFARAPMNHHDAHRPVQSSEVLSEVFTWQEERTMTRNLVVHYQRRSYLIVPSPESLGFAGRRVCLYEAADGQVEIRCAGPPPALYRARQATSGGSWCGR